jgi:nucleoside-triphosphatase THEP1
MIQSLADLWLLFDSPAPTLVVITGPSGAGKTTWCAELAAHARERGLRAAGLLSPGVFADGYKWAIDVVDLATGARRRLAQRRASPDPTSPTRNWQFDDDALTWGSAILTAQGPCDLLIVDELGPLELLHGQGWHQALPLFERGAYRLACAVVRPSLLAHFTARFPAAAIIDLAR